MKALKTTNGIEKIGKEVEIYVTDKRRNYRMI